MYLRTKDMHRHAKIGSILINKKQEKVNNRSSFNSALRASLGSAAFRKGPYRTNSGTTSVQTRLATRWHGSVTFICTVTPWLRKLKSGSKTHALMWTGSCLVPVRRLRPQFISVTYPKQIRMEHLTQDAYAARNNGTRCRDKAKGVLFNKVAEGDVNIGEYSHRDEVKVTIRRYSRRLRRLIVLV